MRVETWVGNYKSLILEKFKSWFLIYEIGSLGD